MSSLQSRLFLWALKKRISSSKDFSHRTVDAGTSVDMLRERVEKGAEKAGRLPRKITSRYVDRSGVRGYWIEPDNCDQDKAILYFHGGGLVIGSARSHRHIVAKVVKASGVRAFVFDYGLAPECPYPKGLEDCLAAYDYLLQGGIDPGKVVFMGDSGGGNLVMSSLLRLRDHSRELPAGAVLLSPWLDLSNTLKSRHCKRDADVLSYINAEYVFADYYAGNHDRRHPYISPLYGDLNGLPPLQIYAGSDEIMLDDAVMLAQKAEQQDVKAALKVGEGLFHCYPACTPFFPEARQAMAEIGIAIKQWVNDS